MNRTKVTLFAGAAVVIAAGLVFVTKTNTPASTSDARGAVGVVPNPSRELNPFNHVASIPATADPTTIRLETLKMVNLASKTQAATYPQNCKERQLREPDGQPCEAIKVLDRVRAVEADYSYIGPQVTTGEGEIIPASRKTFAVYFRPEELPVAVDKLNREQAGSLLQIATSRPMVQEKTIDKQNSHFCEGKLTDGGWMPADPKCQDQVQYTTQTVPSEYWAVEVNLKHPVVASNR
jgi:hypothetical protein